MASRLRGSPLSCCVGALLVGAVATSAPAAVTDVPVAGRMLSLTARADNPSRRTISYRATDASVAAPFADPALGASLFVFASNASGHCRAQIALPAGNWSPLGGSGPLKGWRYRDRNGAAQGIRKVVVRPGKILVKGRGANFPCALDASQQAAPVSVSLRLGETRYCAAFGGTVRANRPGRFLATRALAPATCADPGDVTVATINILHGLFCGGSFCRQAERIALAGQFIVGRGCPDVVAFQEVNSPASGPSARQAIADQLLDVCPFPYHLVFISGNTIDDSLLLSRYPILSSELRLLQNNFRNVLHARVDHPAGAVDVFSTHLASGADGGSNPCVGCPAACVSAGAATLRDCQAVQTALMVEEIHDSAAPAFVVGDFNRTPGSFVYDVFVGRGWPDAYLSAGNAECDALTGTGCTSGREDAALADLEAPALNVDTRIDYIFVVPPGPTSGCSGTLDSGADGDADGTATRHFADEPNPFSPSCGPLPDAICWASDHNGVQADLNCE